MPLQRLGGTPSANWLLTAHQVREVLDGKSGSIIDRYEFGTGLMPS
jgi:hypothetical protein